MENVHGIRYDLKRRNEESDTSADSNDEMESVLSSDNDHNTASPGKGDHNKVYSNDDNDSDNKGGSEDDDTSDADDESWNWVMDKVIESKNKNGKFSDLVKGSKWNNKKVIQALRNEVENLKENLNHIESSEVYQKIEEEKGRLEDHGANESDATKQAWSNNYYLIKRKVINNFGIPEPIKEEGEEEKEEGEEKEEDEEEEEEEEEEEDDDGDASNASNE